jgi:hypothetical protein
MRKPALILLIFLCLAICVSFVQADQPVPFAPLSNVTGYYNFTQGNDSWQVNTDFPISSQDIVYPDWLFGMMLAFIFVTICFGLVFISKDPAPWVSVIACGVIVFGLGLSAALMAPLVGYTEVYHQVISGAVSNTVYVNEIVVYTLGSWIGWACYGLAIGGGLIFVIAGFLLQMKQARKIANQVQAEKIQAEEIDFRKRDRQ